MLEKLAEGCVSTDASSFGKLLQISPDGNFGLVSSENNQATLWYYDLATTQYEIKYSSVYYIGDTIFDLKWFPLMNCNDPISCCFAVTSRDHPVQLWDMYYGTLRASYVGLNALDEIDPAVSICFNLNGNKLFCGSNRMIRSDYASVSDICVVLHLYIFFFEHRSFNIEYPGKNYENIPTCMNRDDCLGQKGIISCINFNPDFSQTYAAGSFADSVGIYTENTNESVLEIRNLGLGGVSSLKWSSCGNKLWIGGRHCDDISCWDVRNTRTELGRVERCCNSNQRMYFDIKHDGLELISGDSKGRLLIFDTTSFRVKDEIVCHSNIMINSASYINNYENFITCLSGQRSFSTDSDSEELSDNEEEKVNSSSTLFVYRQGRVCD